MAKSGGAPSASLSSLLPGVVTGPGHTTFTKIASGARSIASERE
jgi:hypothetical protein